MTLGDRVAVMLDGRIQQVGTPQELFRRPDNLFVASFIGTPSMNLVPATIDRDHVEFGGYRLPHRAERDLCVEGIRDVILGIRPTDFEDAALARDPRAPVIVVQPEVVEDLGAEVLVIFPISAPPVPSELALAAAEGTDKTGPALLVHDDATPTSRFTARLDPHTSARTDSPLRLAVDPGGFHFFHPITGQAIAGPSKTETPTTPARSLVRPVST
jgi:multiple sugar transport system ATP-binding protein